MTIDQWNNLKVGDEVFHCKSVALWSHPLTVEDLFFREDNKTIRVDLGCKHGLTLGCTLPNGNHYHTSAFDPGTYILIEDEEL